MARARSDSASAGGGYVSGSGASAASSVPYVNQRTGLGRGRRWRGGTVPVV
jgi:hypothetical protein